MNARATTSRTALACALALALALTAGCAAQSRRAVASGFIDDAGALSQSPDDANALVYWSPHHDLRDYTAIAIAPVQVALVERQRTYEPEPETLDELARLLDERLAEALAERFQIVDADTPGALRLRAAITDLRPSEPALNLHPAMKLVGFGLGGASVEAELLVAASGERVAAFADARLAGKQIGSGLTRWADARAALEEWAALLALRLAQPPPR